MPGEPIAEMVCNVIQFFESPSGNYTLMNQSVINSLIDECLRIEEDSLYSSKSHFNVSSFWDSLNLWLGVPLGILTALGGIAALKSTPAVVVIFSIAATVLTSLNTSLNPSKRSALHKSSAIEYNKLKNDVRLFRTIELNDETLSLKEIKDKVYSFSSRRSQLNSSSPNIPNWAYRKTQKDIDNGYAIYHVDKD